MIYCVQDDQSIRSFTEDIDRTKFRGHFCDRNVETIVVSYMPLILVHFGRLVRLQRQNRTFWFICH